MRAGLASSGELVVYIFATLTAAHAVSNGAALDESLLTLPSLGAIRGTVRPLSRTWLRVPFAEPPSRWRPPVPKLPWGSDVIDGTRFGAACPQPPGFDPPLISTSEDCLSLAVYAPRATSNASALVPVLVYVHGGSFLNGGAAEARLNATSLVERSGGALAVVVLQYRLGVLGFLGSNSLRHQSGDNSTGNYGLQDQRLALQWVRRYASAFGGDGKRITLAGQSAGAACVSTHVVAPRSAGLIARASIWSGAFPDWAVAQMPMQERLFDKLVKLSCGTSEPAANLRCLESLPVDAIVSYAQQATGAVCDVACLQPTIDGVELTDEPRRLLGSTDLSSVDLMMGCGRDEGDWHHESFPFTHTFNEAAHHSATQRNTTNLVMGCGCDEGDGFDAGSGLARDADERSLSQWFEGE